MSDRRRDRQKRAGRADREVAERAAHKLEIAQGRRCRCGAKWANAEEFLAKQTDLLECVRKHIFRRRPQPLELTRAAQ